MVRTVKAKERPKKRSREKEREEKAKSKFKKLKNVIPELISRSRPRRTDENFILSQEASDTFGRLKLDPIAEMIMYAKGDVVGLGLMTKDELESEEEYNAEGTLVRVSGHTRALELIPPKLRADMAAKLIDFHLARKKPKEEAEEVCEDDQVVVYVPDNGRVNNESA